MNTNLIVTLAACIGLAAILGGLGLGSLGYSQYGKCGATEISVAEVPADDVDNSDQFTQFESLTADQQNAFERALETGEAYSQNRSGFPYIAYGGAYYTARGPTAVCDFPPTTVMALGGGISLAGAVLLGVGIRRGFRLFSAEGP